MKSTTLVNLSYIEDAADSNNELIIEMINIFKAQIPEFIKIMKTSLENRDWNELRLIAHKAKSSVSMMGMNDISQELKTLEAYTTEEINISSYPKIISNFEEACNKAILELNMLISNFS